MAVFLDRIDAVPLAADPFSDEYKAWVTVLVDSLNSVINTVEQNLVTPVGLTGVTQLAVANTVYTPTNVALTSITLPLYAVYGSIVAIVGQGAGGWSLLPNVGQTIEYQATTATVSIASAERYDCIEVMCVVEDTTWVVRNHESTGLVIT